tara:strand:- start:427 stop:600 length:174 start_codon:yes stop_codon:yes gene_type:complete
MTAIYHGDDEICCGTIASQLQGDEHEYYQWKHCPYCGKNIASLVDEAMKIDEVKKNE